MAPLSGTRRRPGVPFRSSPAPVRGIVVGSLLLGYDIPNLHAYPNHKGDPVAKLFRQM